MILDQIKYLNTAQTAKHLGISIKTLANWRSEKKGPKGIKYLGRCYYAEVVLDEFKNKVCEEFNSFDFAQALPLYIESLKKPIEDETCRLTRIYDIRKVSFNLPK